MSKGKSFEALKAEIAQLEAQAAAARRAEVKVAIASIRESIMKYRLTPADLGFSGQISVRPRGRPARPRPGIGVPRYRDPISGKTWTGIGKPPDWIKNAHNREDFLIEQHLSPAAETEPVAKRKDAIMSGARAEGSSSTEAAVKPATKRARKLSADLQAAAFSSAGAPPKIAVRKV